jgi:hypothetical protein
MDLSPAGSLGLVIPIAGFAVRAFGFLEVGPSNKRLQEHIELLPSADGKAAESLTTLIQDEIAAVAARDRRRLLRKVSWASIAALVFIIILTGPVTAFLFALGEWWSYAVGAAIGITGFLFIAVGSTQVFEYPDEDS